MNAPMKTYKQVKEIPATAKGIMLPKNVMNLLIGAEIKWEDATPLSNDASEYLHFFFNSNTKPHTDLLLKKYGFFDVSQYVNLNCLWQVHMQMYYATPNNKEKSHHIDHHYFKFRGTIFPMHENFKKERDYFYMTKNLEHTLVPDDNKNKGYYQTTHFHAVIVGY